MSLLLDDDDVFVPPMKNAKPDNHVLDCDTDSQCINVDQPPKAATSPCAATRTESTPATSSACDAAATTVTLSRKGGNGMEKMEALVFGMPRVSVVHDGTTPKRTRASVASNEEALAAAHHTPTTQKTLRSASQLNSEVCSAVSTATEPKILSCDRSPSSTSPSPLATQRHTSVVSFDDSVVASQDPVPVEPSAQTSATKPTTSLSASPPARPPVKPTTEASSSMTATQPAKMQMKLSDFFSKMACKR